MTLPALKTTAVVYDIRDDAEFLAQIRKATLSNGDLGLSAENSVVGSSEWWVAVESGKVPVIVFEGVILRVDRGPMGDSAIVRVQSGREMKSWAAWKGFQPSLVGQHVEARYVKITPKKPPMPGYLVDLLVEVRVV